MLVKKQIFKRIHTLIKVILFYEFGTPKIKEEKVVLEPTYNSVS